MLNLEDKVTSITFVGPKYEELLENLNIRTVRDLLYHFPFRYDDFSKIKKINELMVGETVTVLGEVFDIRNIFTKNGKRITKLTFADETGKVPVIWFNQIYLAKTFKKGMKLAVSGELSNFDKTLTFISPEFELASDHLLHTGRMVPIYSESKGISSKWLRSRINHLLNISHIKVEEYLPEEILKGNKFFEINEALRKFHFPKNAAEADEARRRFEYEEILEILLEAHTRKIEWQGKKSIKAFESHTTKLEKLIKNLPFELTNSQKICIEEIIKDLSKGKPMNRLLQGDVGSGKTIVAVVASYLTYLNGLKVYFMAPTEILATQHYETFKKFLEPLNIKVSLTTGSQKGEDADIEIGTHALLFKERNMPGLVIIDEQHKFGVEQRSKLLYEHDKETKKFKNVSPHLLTMTATPIPRTLALTIYGDLEISTITEMPVGRQKVSTKVVLPNKRMAAYNWVRNQIIDSKLKNQAFIVCPLIEESEHESMQNIKAATKEFENLSKDVFKDLKVELLHGKMKPKEKEKIISEFKSGKLNVLVSTPVIEVGIDIPSATIVAIETSERFGLASLHQTRGRVGRGSEKSYCILFTESKNPSTLRRLKLLETTHNGLKLAEEDLNIRGQGEVFGTRQSGKLNMKLADLMNIELIRKVKNDIEKLSKDKEAFASLYAHFIKNKNIGAN